MRKQAKNSWILMLFGVLLLAGSMFAWTRVQPYDDGIIVTGTIVEEIRVRGDDGSTYKPRIVFRTAAGERISWVASTSTSSRVSVGETVRMSYQPDNPHAARNLDASGQWMIYIFGTLGIGLCVLGLRQAMQPARTESPTQHDTTSKHHTAQTHVLEAGHTVVEMHQTAADAVRGVRSIAVRGLVGGVGILFGLITLQVSTQDQGNMITAFIGAAIMLGALLLVTSAITRARHYKQRWQSGAPGSEIHAFRGQLAELVEAATDAANAGENRFDSHAPETRASETHASKTQPLLSQSPLTLATPATLPPPLPPTGPKRETPTTWPAHIPPPAAFVAHDPTQGGPDPFDS